MTKELFYQAVLKFVLGVVVIGILLFLPAGTFDYWNAWLFMGILFIPMFFTGIVLMIKNPKLLEKRLKTKEQEPEQSLVIKLSGLMFAMGFVIAGLNFRFQWIILPNWALWDCSTPDVQCNDFFISFYAVSTWLCYFICNFSYISCHYSKENWK